MKTIITTEMKKKAKLFRSVKEWARELPLFDTEVARLISLHKATRRLSKVLNVLTSDYTNKLPKDIPTEAISPWFRESITDAINEVVAHLEIFGALKESVEFACKAHQKKQEQLISFIRKVAATDSTVGSAGMRAEARIKLKQWNLE